jgi:hypothetical protein
MIKAQDGFSSLNVRGKPLDPAIDMIPHFSWRGRNIFRHIAVPAESPNYLMVWLLRHAEIKAFSTPAQSRKLNLT